MNKKEHQMNNKITKAISAILSIILVLSSAYLSVIVSAGDFTSDNTLEELINWRARAGLI